MASTTIKINQLTTGTDGELITWDSSGNPATVATGTAGHVLTSNGAGAAPTFQAVTADGNGIYSGSGNIPDATVANLATPNAEFYITYDNDNNAISVIDNTGVELNSDNGTGYVWVYDNNVQIGAGGSQSTLSTTNAYIQAPYVRIDSTTGSASGELRIDEPSGVNYVALTVPDLSGSNTTYTFPAAYPGANDYVLTATTGGAMSWQDVTTLTSGPAGSGATNEYAYWSDANTLTSTSSALFSSSTIPLDMSAATGAVRLPVGTAAQQPSTIAGGFRYNSDTAHVEWNYGTASWASVPGANVTQDISGQWTFSNANTYFTGTTVRFYDTNLKMVNVGNSATVGFDASGLTASSSRTYAFPDASGTFALVGDLIPATAGGTGLTSYAVGDILYADTTTTLAKLADVSAGSYLRSGGVNTAPVWSTLKLPNTVAAGDILVSNSTNNLTTLAGVATGNALISSGVGSFPVYGKIGLTTHVSGTLPAANGGTGQASYTVGDILYASTTTALSRLADVSSGSYLRSGGTSTAPLWSTLKLPNSATTGDIMYASASNTMSQLAAVSANSFLRSAGTTTAPVWSTTKWTNSATTGDILYASASNTYSNLAGVATGNALISGGVTTAPSWGKIGLTTHVSGTLPITNGGTNITTYATGDILYASASNTLSKLTAGTDTHVLTLSGGVPTWAAPSGGSDGNGIYDGSGSIPDNTVATVASAGDFTIDYNNSNPALYIQDNVGLVLGSDDGLTTVIVGDNSIGAATAGGADVSLTGTTASLGYGSGGYYMDAAQASITAPYIAFRNDTAANGAATRFYEGTTNGLNYISVSAPASIGTDTAYILPVTPTDGYVLQYNTGGQLTWEDPTGWSGDGIYGGSGTIASAAVATITSGSTFTIDYNGGTNGFFISDSAGTFYIQTKNGLNGLTTSTSYAGLFSNEQYFRLDATAGGNYTNAAISIDYGHLAFNSITSPSQITSDQDDYSPSSLASSNVLRLSTDASRTVTGLDSSGVTLQSGRILTIHNVGSNNLILSDEDASSTAANRFSLGSDVTIGSDESHTLIYDDTSSRWRSFTSKGSGGGVSDADYGDIVVTSSGTVWSIDTGVVDNTNLASGTGGIYKGSGTIASGTVATVTASSSFRVNYNSSNPAILVDDVDNSITIGSDAGTNYVYVTDNGIDIVDAHQVHLIAAPSTDHNYSGTTITLNANEAQAFGDVCYIDSTGQAALADADATTTAPAIAMCTETVSANNDATYLTYGIARDDTWAWTVGGFVFLSTTGTTGNTLTQTAPSGTGDVVQIVGIATHADRIFFNPQLAYATVV